MKEYIKAFGKRSKMAQQEYFEYNIPVWRSFRAFKKHIIAHNSDISLIPENDTNNEEKA